MAEQAGCRVPAPLCLNNDAGHRCDSEGIAWLERLSPEDHRSDHPERHRGSIRPHQHGGGKHLECRKDAPGDDARGG